ncbi:hypothetical protein [Xenorhabdus sp. KJ12.1]|uniref:hypothetical protein n=1 Tax=Xenorhabdus sp. KJ12.1 TaxID=1851571 RepID=UPI000C046770|nr:hypothetical protein [Xenorhabdus sp. KJ12.1]PHM72353.1 hypothetical protein Xekj_00632 [Xenorhabdus sp. KJ12.1]
MINPSFTLTYDDINSFRKTGFLHLKQFYSDNFIEYIYKTIGNLISTPTDKYQSGFNRLAFDMYDGDHQLIELLKDPHFHNIMKKLTGRTMFFAQALSFELHKLKDKGFPWHIGTQSFGYQKATDYGCTIWSPLVPIDPNNQRGGMAYVPKDKISGDFMYTHYDPSVFQVLQDKINNNELVTIDDFVHWRDGGLNDSAMKALLEHFAVEDAFQPCDALIFDKYVIHRSVMLEEGELDARAAFVMRFFDSESTYDHRRAQDLEIPRKYFGYSGPTLFHLAVAEKDGEKLINSSLFNNQVYRLLSQ